jgi:hypothetical protein
MASRLPGFSLSPAVAVGMAAGVVSVLRLPLSAVVISTLLTAKAGAGDEPLIIVGVVVAFITTLALSARGASRESAAPGGSAPATGGRVEPPTAAAGSTA